MSTFQALQHWQPYLSWSYNEAGQQVAEASSPRGHFELARQLQPGNYQLEVTGSPLVGTKKNDNNRYELHVAY